MKIKKILRIFLAIVILLNLSIFSYAEEDPDEWNYVWLNEAIEEAQQTKEPKVLSRHAVVYDRKSKTVIWGKDENTPVPMASTTKIMTAIIMMEQIGADRLNEEITVSKEAAQTYGSRLDINTGDKITYNDLLYGLMLCSGNDAAVQIAISVAGSVEEFADLMNKKAQELGLKNTHFVTPHGLDEDGHYTTAFELAKMTDCALNIPKIAQVVSTRNYIVNINGEQREISNTNELLGYLDGVNGVKTGYTSKAGRCLITSVSRDDFDIIVVVLGADTRKIRSQDTIKLIEYTYKEYELYDLAVLINTEYNNWLRINKKRLWIYKGIKLEPDVYIEESRFSEYPIKKNENINIESTATTIFEAPVYEGTEVGKIVVKNENDIIEEIPIRLKETIGRKNVWQYFVEMIQILTFGKKI